MEDGLLKVRYEKWETFNGEFGHMFYKDPFSYYVIAAEHRFVGDQVKGAGPSLAWAIRNNGLMLHAPDPKTMMKDQDFPISIEVQLLGGFGKPRTTANLCTPGTNVVMDGKLETRHCINSKSKTYEGDQWVRVEVLVHGDELMRHYVEGEPVLEYTKPQIGGGNVSPVDPKVKVGRDATHRRLHLDPGRDRADRLPEDRDPQSRRVQGSEGEDLQGVLRQGQSKGLPVAGCRASRELLRSSSYGGRPDRSGRSHCGARHRVVVQHVPADLFRGEVAEHGSRANQPERAGIPSLLRRGHGAQHGVLLHRWSVANPPHAPTLRQLRSPPAPA